MAIRRKIKEKEQDLPILARYELLERIDMLYNLRDKALVCFLYLTAARVEEVVRYVVTRNPGRTIQKSKKSAERISAPIIETRTRGLPIKKKQIEEYENRFIVRGVRSLKRRREYNRDIPIMDVPEDKQFIDTLCDYLNTIDEDTPLFDITRQRAYQILASVELYPHYLRHIRITHMVRELGLSGADLKQFNGWASSRMADNYTHLNLTDLINKMLGSRKQSEQENEDGK